MLIELFGRNFGPFRDEFHLSMLATDIDPGSPRGVVEVPVEGEDEPLRLLRCVGIYGANASGKSRLLLAAHALDFLIEHSAHVPSDRPLGPYEPFLLDEKSASGPAMLGVRAVVDRRVYEYVVEFEGARFLLEKLVELAPDEERILFERHGQEVAGQWIVEKQFALLAKAFRPNALLLSLADELAPSLAGGLAVRFRRLLGYHDFAWNPPVSFGSWRAAERASKDTTDFGPWLLHWIRAADVGIVNYQTENIPVSAESAGETQDMGSKRRRAREYKLAFIHAGSQGPVRLEYNRESVGTLKMVELAPYIHDLTHSDEARAYFIDEIGASVHPVLLQAMIHQFNCETPPENVRGQLVFATHETLVLDAEARFAPLRRDQVYLTEKDANGASRLYSVAEFKERNNLNLRRRYLQGRYGALPSPGRLGA